MRRRDPNAPLSPRLRFDLTRMGVGVLQVTAPQKTQMALRRYYGVVEKMIADSQVEALTALAQGRVTIDQLVDLDRQDRLKGSDILAAAALAQPLFAAWDAVIAGRGGPAWKRYAIARRALERDCARWFGAQAKLAVRDLIDDERVPWDTIAAAWTGGPANWNHIRRALSRFLSVLLRDKGHPFRRQVIGRIPIKAEPKTTPNLSPATFWAIVAHAREDVRPAFVTLVVTGMRCITEYLACGHEHLLHDARALRVPGTKTDDSANVIAIDERMWPWVVAAVPSRVQYKRLRMLWMEACDRAGVARVNLHTLRHLCGQYASDAGQSDGAIASVLRHGSVETTRRYARTTASRNVSRAVADTLLVPNSVNSPSPTMPDSNDPGGNRTHDLRLKRSLAANDHRSPAKPASDEGSKYADGLGHRTPAVAGPHSVSLASVRDVKHHWRRGYRSRVRFASRRQL